jgi:hypothetical protein
MADEFVKCEAVLKAELEALSRAGAAHELVSEAVKRRDWVDFDACISVINEIGVQMEELECERIARMSGISGEAGGFYDFALRFSEEERRILCGLYREVKIEASRMRFRAAALEAYLGGARALVSGLLEAAYPEKRGKIYGKTGEERSARLGGIVLDRRF